MKGETRVMTGKLKKLRIYGIVYLVLGVLDGLNELIGLSGGRYSILTLLESGHLSQQFATFFDIAVLGLAVAVVLGYLCMGVKGYTYGIGEGFGMVHIGVAKIMPALLIVRLIVTGIAIYAGQIDIVPFFTCVAGLVIVFDYNKCARIALES